MKFHYYLENSAGWAGISIEIENFKKNYSIAYGWDGCDIKDLLGGIIALIGGNENFCSDLKEKYLYDDNSIEWNVIAGPDKIKFKFILLDENKIELNIFESKFNSDEDGTRVFTGIVDFNEIIDNILYSCNKVITKYGILGYFKNFWIEFPLFYYLYLKNIIKNIIVCEEFVEIINTEEIKMIKTNINDEFNIVKSI